MYHKKTFVYVGDKKQWPQKIIDLFNVTAEIFYRWHPEQEPKL